MRSSLVGTIPIDIGPGNTTVYTLLNAVDLGTCTGVTVQLVLTTCAADAVDKLDVEFQETRDVDQSYWDTRARFQQVAGNQTASSTTPYAEQMNILATGPLTSGERDLQPTGSAGAADLAKGTVRNGPFQGRLRGSRGIVETHRVSVVSSGDIDADLRFIGNLYVYAISGSDL